MKKKFIKQKKAAPKSRQSADLKLAALAPHEQMHQLFHGRPNDGGFFEYNLRKLASLIRVHEQRDKPFWQEPVGTMKNGQVVDSRPLAEVNAELLQRELDHLGANCRAALEYWQPETFEQIAALMRKIKSEKPRGFNPFERGLGMEPKDYLRALILAESKNGTVNQWHLACHFENTNPDSKLQSDTEFTRTEGTRKTIGEICKRHKIRSKIGRPKVEK